MSVRWITLVASLLAACAQAAEPAAAPAAPPAATPAAPAPKVPAFVANAPMGTGHCDPSEHAVFSCEVSGKRYLSLCTDPEFTQLQYRFGDPEKPDMRSPASSSVSEFHYGHVAWAHGEEHNVWFVNEGHTYKVVSAVGGGGPTGDDGASNNYVGVRVIKDDKELAFVKCVKTPAADFLANLDGVLAP